jgi:hypothetical protein
VMKNHTGTHVLNYALRKVLETEADQGSIWWISVSAENFARQFLSSI